MANQDPSIMYMQPGEPQRKRRWLAVVLVSCLLVAGVAAMATAAFVIGSNKATTSTAATVPVTPKPRGLETAPLGTLLSYVDRRDPASISLTIKGGLEQSEERDMRALLEYLGFNASAVMNRLGNTRALDGTLSAEGRLAAVYWTYHPDAGLSMVFEGKK